ncbi:MAG TPA: V-type ATPase 116kDa subunit family protein [Syntrophorhabdaceae bacterium]|jgi:V/A-type H+-transporting ATPase subunit I
MFRPVSMVRLDAIVLERDQSKVLRDLGNLGVIQLTRTRPEPDCASLAARDLAQWDRVRARAADLRQSLGIAPLPEEPEVKEISLARAEEGLQSIEEKASALLEHRRRLVQRQKELTALCDQVSCYSGLDLPLGASDRFRFLHFVTGSLPEEKLAGLEKEAGEKVALLPAALRKGRRSLVAITTLEDASALQQVLERAGFQHEALPAEPETTVESFSEEKAGEREETAVELERVAGSLRELTEEAAGALHELERGADVECRLLEEARKCSRTEAAVMLSGWLPADNMAHLEERIREKTGGRYAVRATPPDASSEEEVPVLLRHSRLLRPFEMLVSNYGFPSYGELEPTLFVALSYIVMFGMMFGDAGHGAVLAACGLFALLKSPSAKVRDFGLLLLFGGSSSIIFGAIYGSVFGIAFFKHYALWHDPLEGDPMQLMYLAIGFGMVMISLGLVLNMVNRFQRGDVIGGLLGRFGVMGLIFYWGALFLVIAGPAVRSRGLMLIAVLLLLGVPILAWAIKEPLEHILRRKASHEGAEGGMAAALIESLVGAFEGVLGYLANTISFVRLAAYAMSHAALLVAAFVLAKELEGLPLGSVWGVVVIILGNMIAIVLEGIIASVQALRLEYYEFFGKFFSGSGQPFKPFRLFSEDRSPAP